jgi:cytochrome o ubiquinol oxidase subunit 3
MNDEVVVQEKESKVQLGFWLYLMTDAMLFASLFAAYMVLRHNVNGGPGTHDIFSLTFVLAETVILLTSSYTVGLANLALKHGQRREFIGYLIATLVLGATFLVMEVSEFRSLVLEGHSWQNSAFLSAFFTLVATHGLHILIGLMWGVTLGWALYRQGFNRDLGRKFGLFSLFWHFLDIVWIFIFTVVYVLGVI